MSEVSPIQQKRRLIIDRITYLKSLKWNDFIKEWVKDLYDDLEKIDKGLEKKCNCPWQNFEDCYACTMKEK